MAACALPKPGTKYGPCVQSCDHVDCEHTRKQAATACSICGEPIGYDRNFYQEDNWKVLMHAVCLYKQIEAERAAAKRGAQ